VEDIGYSLPRVLHSRTVLGALGWSQGMGGSVQIGVVSGWRVGKTDSDVLAFDFEVYLFDYKTGRFEGDVEAFDFGGGTFGVLWVPFDYEVDLLGCYKAFG